MPKAMLPSFFDKHYHSTERIYASDRLLAATLLRLCPAWIVPNYITLVRFLITPLVLWFLFHDNFNVGIPLFLIAAATDALDGALARTRSQITTWGRMFDPFVDKLLIISVALTMAHGRIPLWLIGTVVVSELFLVLAALYWHHEGRLVQANIWGKLKMGLQVTALISLLLSEWSGLPLTSVASTFLAVSLICAGASFLRYGG